MLSDRDRRTLREMEQELHQADQRSASTFTIRAHRTPRARRPGLVRTAATLAILTALLPMLGLGSIALITASLLGITALVLVVRPSRRNRADHDDQLRE